MAWKTSVTISIPFMHKCMLQGNTVKEVTILAVLVVIYKQFYKSTE